MPPKKTPEEKAAEAADKEAARLARDQKKAEKAASTPAQRRRTPLELVSGANAADPDDVEKDEHASVPSSKAKGKKRRVIADSDSDAEPEEAPSKQSRTVGMLPPPPRAGAKQTIGSNERSLAGNPVALSGQVVGAAFLPPAALLSSLASATSIEISLHLVKLIEESNALHRAQLEYHLTGKVIIPPTPVSQTPYQPAPNSHHRRYERIVLLPEVKTSAPRDRTVREKPVETVEQPATSTPTVPPSVSSTPAAEQVPSVPAALSISGSATPVGPFIATLPATVSSASVPLPDPTMMNVPFPVPQVGYPFSPYAPTYDNGVGYHPGFQYQAMHGYGYQGYPPWFPPADGQGPSVANSNIDHNTATSSESTTTST